MSLARVLTDLTGKGFDATTDEILKAAHVTDEVEIGRMPRGTKGGRSSVLISGRDESGRLVVVEMTMAIFLAAATAFRIVEETPPGEEN